MKVFGYEITRSKGLSAPDDQRGLWTRILDYSNWGAFQQDAYIDQKRVTAHSAVYSCGTLISQDVAKLNLRLMRKEKNIWIEDETSPLGAVLRKPNRYQNRLQFIQSWVMSKLMRGNAYALKVRDRRGLVVGLYLLDPDRVQALVSEDGAVFYRLDTDNLSGIGKQLTVPASEIIHDVMVPLYHPLIGVSPIYACGLAAMQGLNIQNQSASFFGNLARPAGMLSAPGHIADDTAARLKDYWQDNFTGKNSGKVAVAGDGLEFKSMTMTAMDAQLIDQLRWSSEDVARCFHLPRYKIGVGDIPTGQGAEVLNQIYYSDCLQAHIESIELALDGGLELDRDVGCEFDLHDLMRMDTATRFKTWDVGIKAGLMAPNEARQRENLPAATGGDSPMIQQQNYSLAALAKRDAKEDPFGTESKAPAPAPSAVDEPKDEPTDKSMTGAQVISIQETVAMVARGEISKATAKGIMAAAFTALSAAQIAGIVDGIEREAQGDSEAQEFVQRLCAGLAGVSA